MKNAAIGVDIGGTSVKLGLVTRTGRLVFRDSFPTGRNVTRPKLLEQLVSRVLDLKRRAARGGFKILGLGVGAPGPIDVEKGRVHFFPNIPGWRNTPLKAILRARVHTPVFVDNDASAMAFGEYCFGAGRGSKHMIALTLGTGVGGGLVINGRLFCGRRFSAGEIGHLVINENGPLCACGSRGCVETYVGNRYFVSEVRRQLRKGSKSILTRWLKNGRRELSPLLVAQAAGRGDAFSRKIWWQTGQHLGTALAGLCNILNPDTIILGGGIAQNGCLIFDPVITTIRKKAFPIAARSVRVIPAKLGVDAGVIGAAALVFSDAKESR